MAKAARQVDTPDFIENLLAVLSDTSDFLDTYRDTIDSPFDAPASDLKDRIDTLLLDPDQSFT